MDSLTGILELLLGMSVITALVLGTFALVEAGLTMILGGKK